MVGRTKTSRPKAARVNYKTANVVRLPRSEGGHFRTSGTNKIGIEGLDHFKHEPYVSRLNLIDQNTASPDGALAHSPT
jgi:hypothetical protein